MKYQQTNPCTRCGKERIDAKSWVETIDTFNGKTTITHTETVCPDPTCQKVVAEGLAKQKEKSDTLKHDREERMKKSQENRRRSKLN